MPPKRPPRLEADVVRFMNEKESWIAVVGLYDSRPYEIFTGRAVDSFSILTQVSEGKVIKVKEDGKYHAMAQADLIDARMVAEGPVPFLKKWNFIAGARRSYVDVWLKPVLEQAGAGVTAAPVYYDYQLFLETRPTSNSQFRIGVYGSDDRLEILIKNPSSQDPTLGGDLGLRTGFWRLQAEYKHQLTERLKFSSVLSYGFNTINFNLGSLYFKLDTHPITNRLEFSYKLDKRVTLNAGQDIIYNPFDIDLRAPQPPRPGEPDSGPFVSRPPRVVKESNTQYLPAAFVEAEILPVEGGRLVPGVRLADQVDQGEPRCFALKTNRNKIKPYLIFHITG